MPYSLLTSTVLALGSAAWSSKIETTSLCPEDADQYSAV